MALADRRLEHERRQDRRAGEIVAMLYNAHRKQDARALDWLDFFPQWQEQPPEQTEQEMLEVMMTWARTTAPRES